MNIMTGVYCFDTYIKYVREKGVKVLLQMHDEILFQLGENEESFINQILTESIKKVNAELTLNVPLDISMDFGKSYADVH